MYKKLDASDISFFSELLGKENIIVSDAEALRPYAKDYTESFIFPPDIVLKPRTTEEISLIMKHCFKEHIAVTPRGGGTGMSGGALAHKGGIVLSVEKLNKILKIDEENLQVVVEPGVVTETLQLSLKEKGLFYPPDPASKGSCFIGGNIAENSGGPRAVKYGVVKDYVLNLRVVLPDGEVIWTGANTLKNATGYNLTQLIVGSEGTLGIVTEIVLKLIPYPKHELVILAPFTSLEEASKAVSRIFMKGFVPSVLELMERDSLLLASAFIQGSIIKIDEDTKAHLIIAVDGNDVDVLRKEIEEIAYLLDEEFGVQNILFAEDSKQQEELWKMRRIVAEAAILNGYLIEEDVVAPRAQLPHIIKTAKFLSKKYAFECICYGHAGDGNIHIRIKKEGTKNSKNDPALQSALVELFTEIKRCGGTISGEHGIGLLQKNFLPLVFSPVEIRLQKEIKKVFDPSNILNPGKIFDI